MSNESPPYYFGFDCSGKAVHVVVLDENYLISTLSVVRSSAKTSDGRLEEISDQLDGVLGGLTFNRWCVLSIEAPLYIGNPHTTIVLAEIVASVKIRLWDLGHCLVEATNTSWKKAIVGKGNASKQQIKEFATKQWPELRRFSRIWGRGPQKELEQDFYDAACIALWGAKETHGKM